MRTKKVIIRCLAPIYDVIPNRPLIGVISYADFTVEQIRKCIVGKANVREILPNGQYKVLDLTNYDKFEEDELPKTPEKVVVEPKKEVKVDKVAVEPEVKEEKTEELPVEEKKEVAEEIKIEEVEQPNVTEEKVEETLAEEKKTEEVEKVANKPNTNSAKKKTNKKH